jgi:hypothetical protein
MNKPVKKQEILGENISQYFIITTNKKASCFSQEAFLFQHPYFT